LTVFYSQAERVGACYPTDAGAWVLSSCSRRPTLGKEHSYGGHGKDRILADDGNEDMINCGKGTDTVEYDQGIDTIKSCEQEFPDPV